MRIVIRNFSEAKTQNVERRNACFASIVIEMIKADIPQDVTEYKEQFFLGMTGRQLVCVVLMLVLAVGTFLIGRNFVTTDILVYLNGMGIEKIAIKVKDFYFRTQRRKMEYLPSVAEIHDTVRKIELARIETERKAELKELKKTAKTKRKK